MAKNEIVLDTPEFVLARNGQGEFTLRDNGARVEVILAAATEREAMLEALTHVFRMVTGFRQIQKDHAKRMQRVEKFMTDMGWVANY